jgi:hypothetical protein
MSPQISAAVPQYTDKQIDVAIQRIKLKPLLVNEAPEYKNAGWRDVLNNALSSLPQVLINLRDHFLSRHRVFLLVRRYRKGCEESPSPSGLGRPPTSTAKCSA